MIDYGEIQEKILEQFIVPYIHFPHKTEGQKIMLAQYISNLDVKSLLIPSCYIFSYSPIVAGLTEKHVEYVAKNAPAVYKTELLNAVSQDYKLQEIFNIAKLMDDDLGNNSTENQMRIRNIVQYIKDNKTIFEF